MLQRKINIAVYLLFMIASFGFSDLPGTTHSCATQSNGTITINFTIPLLTAADQLHRVTLDFSFDNLDDTLDASDFNLDPFDETGYSANNFVSFNFADFYDSTSGTQVDIVVPLQSSAGYIMRLYDNGSDSYKLEILNKPESDGYWEGSGSETWVLTISNISDADGYEFNLDNMQAYTSNSGTGLITPLPGSFECTVISPCNTAPTVDGINASPSTDQPLYMVFSAETPNDPDGDNANLQYEWDFESVSNPGVHTVTRTVDTAFTYEDYTEGTYTARLRVKDENGAYSPWVSTVVHTNQRPVANFTATPNSGIEPLSVTINPGGTSDPDTTSNTDTTTTDDTDQFIVQYQWDWDGDGIIDQKVPDTLDPDPDTWTSANNSAFDHEYPLGPHNTGLIVMDNRGLLSDADSGTAGIQPEKQDITVLSNEYINFPRAIGVPRDTNKSPLIDGILSGYDTSTTGADQYGENGWRGAYVLNYGDGTTDRDVVCNAIKDSSADILYLSFDVDFDTYFGDTDVIILGIRGNSIDPLAVHSINDRLIKIYPKKSPAADQIEVYYLTGGVWNVGFEPADLIFATREDSGGHNWQIEIQIPMSEDGDWKEINDEFLFYYDFYRSYSDPIRMTSHFHFPMEVEDIADITDLSSYQFDPKFWGKADLTGSGSLNGLSLSSASQIGVQNPSNPTGSLTNSMRYDADWETNGNNEVNTFVARVFSDYRQEVLVGGNLWIKMLPVNKVRVHFKFANWGLPSIYPEYWTDLPSDESGDGYTPYAEFEVNQDIEPTADEFLVDPSLPGSDLLMSETQEYSLNWTLSDEFISDVEGAVANTADGINEAHQCILAEIESLSTARIVSKSVHRNMNFNAVNDTAFSYPAVISAEGYGIPGNDDPKHKFLLKIFTKEWIVSPEEVLSVNKILESGVISDKFGSIMRSIQQEILVRHKGNMASISAANKGERKTKSTEVPIEQLAQIPYLDEIYHFIKDEHKPVSFIEYVIKGFRYTGKKTIINGIEHDLVEPIGSYGHVVRHIGPVEDWDFYIDGAERIDKNTYIIKIPPEQTATITDNVKAIEPPKFRIHVSSGGIFPIDTFADDYKPGPNFILGAGYYLNPQYSLHALFGYNYLYSNISGIDDTTLMSLAVNARRHFPLAGKLSWYAGAGGGAYWDTDRNVETGVNSGLGINLRLNHYLELEAGADYHYLVDSQHQYVHGHVGIQFRF